MFNCGEKFNFKNVAVDVEIVGVFPASQTKDGITEYVALFNGEKMKVKESFFEMLKKAEVKEEKQEFVNADLKAPSNRVIVRVNEEETKEEVKEIKPKKERKKNARRK